MKRGRTVEEAAEAAEVVAAEVAVAEAVEAEVVAAAEVAVVIQGLRRTRPQEASGRSSRG